MLGGKLQAAGTAMFGLMGCGLDDATDAADQAIVTRYELTCAGLWDPYGFLGTPVGTFDPSDGKIICPGYPNDPARAACPPGGSTYARGWVFTNRVTCVGADAALATGDGRVVVNVNWDANGEGPLWGTWEIFPDAGGTWQGNFQGTREELADGCEGIPCWVEHLHIVGSATGGDIDGMQGRFDEAVYTYAPTPLYFRSTIVGEAWLPH